jgi:hypothetical protein
MNELLEELKTVLAKHNAYIKSEAREEYEDGEWVGRIYLCKGNEEIAVDPDDQFRMF